MAGRHFIEHYTERKQIGAGVQRLATRLLRRHVTDRPHGSPRRGELIRADGCWRPNRGGRSIDHMIRLRSELGEAEIEDFRLPALSNKNVCRLYVAMHNSAGVRRLERVRD